jgi:uncharacterized protein YukE
MAGQQVIVSVLADTRRFNSAMAGTDRTLRRFQTGLTNINRVGVAAFTALTYAAARFTQQGIRYASDYESSSLGLINVFGEAADKVRAFADAAQNSAGLSAAAYQTAAARIGNALAVMGLSSDETADKTNDLIQVAADLSATYGGTVTEAVDRLNSALIGEYDGLQRLIPGISAAAIETEALALANKKSAKELTAAEKAAGTYSLILKLTEKDQGAFAKNSSSFNVRLAKLTAAWQNASTKIFQAVIQEMGPALDDLTVWLNDFADSPEGVALAEALAEAIKDLAAELPGLLKGLTKVLKKMDEWNISILDLIIGFTTITTLLRFFSGNIFNAYLTNVIAASKRNKLWAAEMKALDEALGAGSDAVKFHRKEITKLEKKQKSNAGLTKEQTRQLKEHREELKKNSDGVKKLSGQYEDLNTKLGAAGKTIDETTGKVKSNAGWWGKLTEVFENNKALNTVVKLLGKAGSALLIIEGALKLGTGFVEGFTTKWAEFAEENPNTIRNLETLGGIFNGIFGFALELVNGLFFALDSLLALLEPVGKWLGEDFAESLGFVLNLVSSIVDGIKFITGWQPAADTRMPEKTYIGPAPTATPTVSNTNSGNTNITNNVTVQSLVPTSETGRVVAKSLAKYQRNGGKAILT